MIVPIILGAGTIAGFLLYRKFKKSKINQDSNFIEFSSNSKLQILYNNYITNIKNKITKITDLIDSVPYVIYKRIHSITGTIFLGGFVIFHYINNSLAKNPKLLNKFTKKMHKFPLLPLIEIFGIYIPLTIHIVIGIILLRTSKINYNLPYETNYRFILQRITAYIILFTLIFHLKTVRFNEYLPEFIRKALNIPSKRDFTFQKVNIWFKPPLRPIGLLIYKLFTLSVAYHLSNGLWTSFITWGIAKTYKKQKQLRDLSNIVFFILAFWGLLIIHFYSQDYNNSKHKKNDSYEEKEELED